jgi:hypothetical protein
MNVPSSRGSENRKYNPIVMFLELNSTIIKCYFMYIPNTFPTTEIVAPLSRPQRAMMDHQTASSSVLVFRRNHRPSYTIIILHNLRRALTAWERTKTESRNAKREREEEPNERRWWP